MFAAFFGIVLIALALWDTFEVIVLPRRIRRRFRLARLYYRATWVAWRGFISGILPPGRDRQSLLSVFGPMSLMGLLLCWVLMLICGFALIHWGLGTLVEPAGRAFTQCLYNSGETFFTLGYGDITPVTGIGKFVSVAEAGMGFGFMAIVIGYFPVLYSAFSERERHIALLDARAGSPPTAGELLRRTNAATDAEEIDRFLLEWELWAAALLESHLSFPVLGFYRSQHDNQSWLAALSTVLDVSATLLVTADDECRRRAELTFAMARHACVDLCLIFWLPPIEPEVQRLTTAEVAKLFDPELKSPATTVDRVERLAALRVLYEPFLQTLSNYFRLSLPRFYPDQEKPDNWQTSAWTQRAPGITELPTSIVPMDKHFG